MQVEFSPAPGWPSPAPGWIRQQTGISPLRLAAGTARVGVLPRPVRRAGRGPRRPLESARQRRSPGTSISGCRPGSPAATAFTRQEPGSAAHRRQCLDPRHCCGGDLRYPTTPASQGRPEPGPVRAADESRLSGGLPSAGHRGFEDRRTGPGPNDPSRMREGTRLRFGPPPSDEDQLRPDERERRVYDTTDNLADRLQAFHGMRPSVRRNFTG